MATERKRRRGRPPKELTPGSSLLAALGAKLRELRKARSLTLVQLSELTGYSCQHLGAIERGAVAPSESVISSCDAGLGAGGVLNGLLPGVIREQAHLRHNSDAARRTGSLQHGPAVDWERLSTASTRPSAVSKAVVEDIEAITAHQRHLYHQLTSAQMLAPVDGHLGLLLSLLDTPSTDSLRLRLASAAGEAAGFAAWIWFDLSDPFKMTYRYRTALSALTEAGDLGLRSYVTAFQAVMAHAAGRFDEAVEYSMAALDMAEHASVGSVTKSWIHAVHATALAHTNDHHGALSELGRAQDMLDRADERRDEWMYDFDQERLLGYRGNCLMEVGRYQAAVAAFERALQGVPATCVRRRAEISVDLAEALVRQGETDEAVRIAKEAVTVFLQRGSLSGVSRVKRLRKRLAAHHHGAAVRDLDGFVRAWRG
ncbi:helix-turn-helix domain-containing protein [Nonomuraea sp. SMC257]|uniref:Helix-turn-helix domain-containing protein n=1 Tax=Nonomuraea montanisoli TaxID=2741721 RepID=A0A7Y6IET2_9ACTN|nr:tetratricopeptide repeat protein [Nonomuraea montanisoli]NUW36280.1 helix-turn-helix domain-containing protein [Nonomuraea montanisoli]